MKANEDKREYTYCMVRFSNAHSEFSYLTEDRSIKEGDFVKVPFGSRNIARTGLVMRVLKCTGDDAPYPPDKTKYVLGKTEKPETWDVPKQRHAETEPEPAKVSGSQAEATDKNIGSSLQGSGKIGIRKDQNLQGLDA